MSEVPKSKRKKSRLEAQHMAYAVRKRILAELMKSFAVSQKRLESHVAAMTANIQDPQEREEKAALLRELEQNFDCWFIQKERDDVLALVKGITRNLRMGNTVFPSYYSEFNERRLRLDRALEYCNALQDELQCVAEAIPCDKNKYTGIVLDIEKLFNYIKALRASDNKFLPDISKREKDLGGSCLFCPLAVSAANFANCNSNGNANYNNASNSNGVRPDFINVQHSPGYDPVHVTTKGGTVHEPEPARNAGPDARSQGRGL